MRLGLSPYEFSNNNGEPDGYNIELLQTIFNKLDIPCKFLLKEWNDATHAFERREADLIIDPSYHYHVRPYIRSANILNYYKVKLVLGQHARHITKLADFTESDTLISRRTTMRPTVSSRSVSFRSPSNTTRPKMPLLESATVATTTSSGARAL